MLKYLKQFPGQCLEFSTGKMKISIFWDKEDKFFDCYAVTELNSYCADCPNEKIVEDWIADVINRT